MNTQQTMRSHLCLLATAMHPSVPTMFCVWPEGNEYPVAAPRADSTMVKLGSSTHGRGMRKISFSH